MHPLPVFMHREGKLGTDLPSLLHELASFPAAGLPYEVPTLCVEHHRRRVVPMADLKTSEAI